MTEKQELWKALKDLLNITHKPCVDDLAFTHYSRCEDICEKYSNNYYKEH